MEIRPNNSVGNASPVSGVSAKTRVQSPSTDAASFSGSEALSSTLQSLPNSRPEAVEQAKGLVSNPDYPPPVVIKKISNLIAAHINENGAV
jgi:hypothetical protein